MLLRMIYPEERLIPEHKVIAWAHDRMIDNAIEIENMRRREAGDANMTDDEIEVFKVQIDPPYLDEAIERLSDDGVAEFRRMRT